MTLSNGNKFEFYVFDGLCTYAESPKEAVEIFKNKTKGHSNSTYVAIGVNYDGLLSGGSVDLINLKDGIVKVSKDIEQSDIKDEKIITLNSISIMKELLEIK